jgi:hypothetical protein
MKFIALLLVSILAIGFLRAVIGLLAKGFSDLVAPPSKSPAQAPRPPEVPLSGELKKDPVCGTYVSAATSVKKTVNGRTLHFCSTACRDRHS